MNNSRIHLLDVELLLLGANKYIHHLVTKSPARIQRKRHPMIPESKKAITSLREGGKGIGMWERALMKKPPRNRYRRKET